MRLPACFASVRHEEELYAFPLRDEELFILRMSVEDKKNLLKKMVESGRIRLLLQVLRTDIKRSITVLELVWLNEFAKLMIIAFCIAGALYVGSTNVF